MPYGAHAMKRLGMGILVLSSPSGRPPAATTVATTTTPAPRAPARPSSGPARASRPRSPPPPRATSPPSWPATAPPPARSSRPGATPTSTEPDFSDFVAAVPQQYPDPAITAWRVVDVDGDTAMVEYDTGVEAIDAEGPKQWVNESGGWKYDGCADTDLE